MRSLAIVLLLACAASAASPREERARAFHDRAESEKTHAWAVAKRQGWAPKRAGRELMAIRDGRVWMRRALNKEAAISVAADLVRNTAPYHLSGSNLVIGLWDEGPVLASHYELTGRVTNIDGGAAVQHATAAAGIIAASGIDTQALGMAPGVHLDCYDWNSDVAEVTTRAMESGGETGKLQLSNHSYDYSTGWDFPYWYGIHGMSEDSGFGIYDSTARDLDLVAYNAPYYLHVKAGGNDRGDIAPFFNNQTYYYFVDGERRTGKYSTVTGPFADGYADGGYDTMPHEQNAKNILVVGAVTEAVASGTVRDVASAQMSSFSSWGPTDDGRIKPDVVANGTGIYTTDSLAENTYVTVDGTSYSAPGASGVAALLVDYHGRLFPQKWMRASTLKGLIIHTADDLGRPGPDYQFGWGLVDAQAAAEQLRQHALDRTRFAVLEDFIDGVSTSRAFYFVRDDTNDVRVTLCWTDPPGPLQSSTNLDEITPRLVHDLDMELVGPDGVTNRPWVLSLAQPTNNATTGDNDLDNVEQILVAVPPGQGLYRLQIGLEGSFATNRQDFSVLVSGLQRVDIVASVSRDDAGFATRWNAASGVVYSIEASEMLGGQSWTALGSVTGAGGEAILVDTNAYPAAYYRLRSLVP
jgi:hypothetical protein